MRNFLVVSVLLLVVTGCATMPRVKQSIVEDLSKQKTAVAVYMEEKEIVYNELVYKVLWNESRQQKSNFTGFWDVDGELSRLLSEELRTKELNTVPIADVLSKDEYRAFEKAVLETKGKEDGTQVLKLPAEMVAKLKESGVGYLMMIQSSNFYMMQTTALNSSAIIMMPSVFIVYNVNTRTQEYRQGVMFGASEKYGDSPRNLEANNLALLKDVGRKSIKGFVEYHAPKIFLQQ